VSRNYVLYYNTNSSQNENLSAIDKSDLLATQTKYL